MRRLLCVALCFAAVHSTRAQSEMLTFTGPEGNVSVPHDAALVPQQITIEAWIYYDPSAPGGGSHPTICRKNAGAESYILRVYDTQSPTLAFVINRTPGGITGIDAFGFPVPPNSWHHAAATFDGVTAKIYMDGVLLIASTVPGSINVTGGPLLIGQGNSQSERWKGHLDELRIWSVARTQSEIQANMNWRFDDLPGLVAAFHFDGSFNDTTGDRIGTPFGTATLVPSTSPVVPIGILAPNVARIGSIYQLDLYSPQPNMPYLFDISLTGTSPGIQLPAPALGNFPLNPPLLNLEFGPYPQFAGFIGTTNSVAVSTSSIALPPSPQLIGLVFSGAFVALDATAPGGIGYVSQARTTTIADFEPMISGVVPSVCSIHGLRPLTISGAHFYPGATVRIAGALAFQVVVVNSTTITCLAPPGPPGPSAPATVVVTNADGGSTANSTVFFYLADLAISAVVPEPPIPGAPATLVGDGFEAGLTIDLAGVTIVPTSVSPASVSFIAPATMPCDATLTVSNPNGQIASISVNRQVEISALAPPHGPSSGGNPVFLLGNDFTSTDVVAFDGVPATIVSATTSAILVIAPPGTTGTALVTVTGVAGCSDSFVYIYQ